MICVIATVKLKEGKKDAYLAELRKIIPDVHKENGCIEYAPYIHIDSGYPVVPGREDDAVVVIEKWESIDALRMHAASCHMDSYRQSIKDILQSVQVRVLNPA
jgi:quinol monooxygenase YgiN